MFPNSHTTNAFGFSYLFVAISIGVSHTENSLVLRRKASGHIFIDIRKVTVICRSDHTLLTGNELLYNMPRLFMPKTIETLITNTRQQIMFGSVGLEYSMRLKQVGKDIADQILALLLIEENAICHPEHCGIVLLE